MGLNPASVLEKTIKEKVSMSKKLNCQELRIQSIFSFHFKLQNYLNFETFSEYLKEGDIFRQDFIQIEHFLDSFVEIYLFH